jgi:hypothetical protein
MAIFSPCSFSSPVMWPSWSKCGLCSAGASPGVNRCGGWTLRCSNAMEKFRAGSLNVTW